MSSAATGHPERRPGAGGSGSREPDPCRFELAVRGWTLVESRANAASADAAELARSVLGPAATPEAWTVSGGWTVADPLPAGEPVGPPRSLVRLHGEGGGAVRFVPGSQGCGPPRAAGDAVVEVVLGPGRSLVLDGRCWLVAATDGGADPRGELWLARPVAAGATEGAP